MHETGCSGLVHWDDPEGWDEEGGGRGVQDGEHMYNIFLKKENGNQKIAILISDRIYLILKNITRDREGHYK